MLIMVSGYDDRIGERLIFSRAAYRVEYNSNTTDNYKGLFLFGLTPIWGLPTHNIDGLLISSFQPKVSLGSPI